MRGAAARGSFLVEPIMCVHACMHKRSGRAAARGQQTLTDTSGLASVGVYRCQLVSCTVRYRPLVSVSTR